MEDSHVVYRPASRDIGESGHWVEIWKGLPNIDFEDVPTGKQVTRGPAYRHESKGVGYVWVPREAREAYDKDPITLFRVSMRLASPGKINAWWVSPCDGDRRSAIAAAREMNNGYKEEAEASARKQKQKEERIKRGLRGRG